MPDAIPEVSNARTPHMRCFAFRNEVLALDCLVFLSHLSTKRRLGFSFPSVVLLRAAVINVTEVRRVIFFFFFFSPLLVAPFLICGPVLLISYIYPVNRVVKFLTMKYA